MPQGELVQWNDSRGFGFIRATDGQRYFVHISNVGRIATRPREGDLVSFAAGKSRDGRLEARSVSIQGANPKPSAEALRRGVEPSVNIGWRFILAGLLAFALMAGALLGHVPWLFTGLYAGMGLISLLLYGTDKRFAEQRKWRISEATLLGIDLCFGIMGGLIGQQVYRHKTRKQAYVATTLLITGVHLLWLGGLALGFIDPAALANIFPDLVSAFS